MSTVSVADRLFTDPKARADQLAQRYHDAHANLTEQLREAGLPIDGDSLHGRAFSAGHHLSDFWERRAQRLERVFRWLLASDHLTEDQRTEICAVLVGRQSVGRDPKLLTESEQQLLAHYRATDTDGKVMLRTLMARIAGEPWEKKHNRQHRELAEARDHIQVRTGSHLPRNIAKPVIDLAGDDREGA